MVGMSRRMSTPGVSAGTRNIEARWCGRASGSVTAITIRKSATEALLENHLWPVITQSSPSRTARVRKQRRVGAGGSGSVIENADSDRPRAAARASAPSAPACRRARGSRALPESGAWQPNTYGANGESEDLVHQAELDLAEALPAELRVEVRRPQAALLDLLLQRRVERSRAPGRAVEHARAARSPPARTARTSPAAPRTRARSRNPMPSQPPDGLRCD